MHFFPTLVLVGVDGTAASHHALLAAVELCRATGSELRLIHVKLRRPLLRGQPMTPPQRERTDTEARELLDRERQATAENGWEATETYLRYADNVADAFVAVQDEVGAGLLVLGESTHGTVARMLTSSTSSTGAVRRSHASVLVVRQLP